MVRITKDAPFAFLMDDNIVWSASSEEGCIVVSAQERKGGFEDVTHCMTTGAAIMHRMHQSLYLQWFSHLLLTTSMQWSVERCSSGITLWNRWSVADNMELLQTMKLRPLRRPASPRGAGLVPCPVVSTRPLADQWLVVEWDTKGCSVPYPGAPVWVRGSEPSSPAVLCRSSAMAHHPSGRKGWAIAKGMHSPEGFGPMDTCLLPKGRQWKWEHPLQAVQASATEGIKRVAMVLFTPTGMAPPQFILARPAIQPKEVFVGSPPQQVSMGEGHIVVTKRGKDVARGKLKQWGSQSHLSFVTKAVIQKWAQ